jgi:hypothetical protein
MTGTGFNASALAQARAARAAAKVEEAEEAERARQAAAEAARAAVPVDVAGLLAAAEAERGLGRVIALYHRSSTLHRIHSDIRRLYF